MHTFNVWAPAAAEVKVRLEEGGAETSLSKGDGGWHTATVADAGPGTRYRYVVDGNAPVPDPRSACQPEGVHGPSEIVDQTAFRWTDDGWRGLHLPSAVIYELHVGTFTPEGTFRSAIDKLDHLVELGVDAVELLPVVEFSGTRGWGYDGVDLFAPHHAYGGPDGLKSFIDAAHGKGLGVIIDAVYNHMGPDGNYLGAFGPYFTEKYGTPWGQAVNFDGPQSDEVRRFVIDNALMWLRDYHADGLRLDAVHAILDFSAFHILEAIAVEVEALAAAVGRHKFVIAESDLNDPRIVQRRELGGYGMDAQWSDDFHHALHAVLTGERNGYYADFGSLDDVADAIENAFVYTGQYADFRERSHGRMPAGIPSWRFLGYLQNHDQVGNRAIGERSAALMSEGRAKIGAAFVLLSPFIPMLFQGEEWAASTPFQYFTDHVDADLGAKVSQGRRDEFRHFGWDPESVPDPQAESTFTDSKLDWEERHRPPHAAMLAWHRDLISLRRSEPSLNDGGADLDAWSEGDVLVMRRGDIHVVANVGAESAEAEVDGTVVLASGAGVSLDGGVLIVPPDGVAVVRGG